MHNMYFHWSINETKLRQYWISLVMMYTNSSDAPITCRRCDDELPVYLYHERVFYPMLAYFSNQSDQVCVLREFPPNPDFGFYFLIHKLHIKLLTICSKEIKQIAGGGGATLGHHEIYFWLNNLLINPWFVYFTIIYNCMQQLSCTHVNNSPYNKNMKYMRYIGSSILRQFKKIIKFELITLTFKSS